VLFRIIFFSLVFCIALGCGTDKNDIISLYNRYSKFENNLSEMRVKLNISSQENKSIFDIKLSSGKVTLNNLTLNSKLSSASVFDGTILLHFADGKENSVEDTAWNRISSGIPDNLGINPYIEFKSDIQPKIKKISANELWAIQLYDGKQIIQKVVFADGKIEKSSTFFEDTLLRETFYYEHSLLSNKLYFPKKIITIIYPKDKEPLKTEQIYEVNEIKFK